MKKHKVLTMLLVLCFALINNAKSQVLHIGDHMPPMLIKNIINSKQTILNYPNDFAGKPLIIDFWFIGCAPCMELMPHLDSLQKKYDSQLNVLLVGAKRDKPENIYEILKGIKALSQVKLPIAAQDSMLHKMFPHRSDPHEIWIDKNGIIKAITGHQSVTEANVLKLIQGIELDLPVKFEITDQKDLGEKLIFLDEKYSNGKLFKSYSYFSEENTAIGSDVHMGTEFDKVNSTFHFLCMNAIAATLYEVAYIGLGAGDLKVIEDYTKHPEYKDKRAPKPFCYESYFKDTSSKKISELMLRDLDANLELKSNIEMRNIDCYVIEPLKGSTKSFQSGSQKQTRKLVDGVKYYTHWPLQGVMGAIDEMRLGHDIINNTGYHGAIDISLPITGNYEQVKKSLNEIGLDLNLKSVPIKCIVLRDAQL